MALYMVKERLKTFENCKWPFDDKAPCSVQKVAEAGFYYVNGTEDTTVCVVCQKELEGWEEGDSPLKEHQKHSPDCPFLTIADPYKLSLRQVISLETYALECIKKRKMANTKEKMMKNVEHLLEVFDKHMPTK
ncbi:baculoviral IAP repeat-containing protein 5.2-A-like [Dysidea avara]|uniref:baculoviral IAP repeat-containing protein 5.2-A-like n=1 Tax=Dysidea avara TaxID=196820 RepID=UPI00331E1066